MDSKESEKTGAREQQIVAAVNELPILPSVAARVVTLANDPRSSAQEICEVIRSDPSLTARILRTVNSVYYGFQHRIDTVAQATVMIGTRDLVALVLGSTALKTLEEAGRDVPHLDVFWLHSVSCAVAAKEVAAQFRYRVPGTAFVGGLLHDIGKLILIQHFPDEYAQVKERVATSGTLLEQAEEDAFGADHARVGAALAKRWSLPPALIEAVAFHHDPGRASEEHALLVAMIHLADILAHRRPGRDADPRAAVLDEHAFARLRQARLDFDASYLDKLLADLEGAMQKSAQLLGALGVNVHDSDP